MKPVIHKTILKNNIKVLAYKNHQWYFVVANIESKLVNLLNISKIKELYEMGETQECNDITMQNFQQFMVKMKQLLIFLLEAMLWD